MKTWWDGRHVDELSPDLFVKEPHLVQTGPSESGRSTE